MNPAIEPAPILVVDDEQVIALALGETLRQAKYEVLALSDPLQAIEALRSNTFSVIITDQKMPGLSGLDLLAEARRVQPSATRILITGVLNLDTVIEAINQGEIFRFIVKPWIREEFLATVSNAHQRYELMCHNMRLEEQTREARAQLARANNALEEKAKTVALQSRQMADQSRALEDGAIQWLDHSVQMLEAFCARLGAQARCVSKVCQSISNVLALDAEERHALESASHLYDIGLLSLPRSLIRRWQELPQELTGEEKALIHLHPVYSQELVGRDGGRDEVGKIVRSHHERFDGSGYPDGLRNEEVPWLARLLAVAVSYASSDSSPAKAMQHLQAGSGSLFDPPAAQVVLRALPQAGLPARQREIAFKDLTPGMILARAVYSHNGLLLVPEGQRLNAAYIEQLVAHQRGQNMSPSLLVYC